MSAEVTIVSVHRGASTPATDVSPTPVSSVPGFQSYALLTSISPAHVWPSLVLRVYFMSRYARLAGDMMIFVPEAAAAATAEFDVVVPQYCATVEGSRVVLVMSCQPTTVLPCAATICCTLPRD